MRRLIKNYLPDPATLAANRWLAPFGATLLHPCLWHLNRRSAAGAVAVGLFCGLIPGPFQMLGAALVCLVWRVNLPLALFTTLYTNPFTIVPLYILAFGLGELILGPGPARFTEPPEWHAQSLSAWVLELVGWLQNLGQPLALGLLVLASGLALVGYGLTRLAWRWYLVRRWQQRQALRP